MRFNEMEWNVQTLEYDCCFSSPLPSLTNFYHFPQQAVVFVGQ